MLMWQNGVFQQIYQQLKNFDGRDCLGISIDLGSKFLKKKIKEFLILTD
jgi:hypothetical protein